MKIQDVEQLDRDQLAAAWLNLHPGFEVTEWTRNGRAKIVNTDGEIASYTQRELRNEVASGIESPDALTDILAAAIPDGVADTTGGTGQGAVSESESEAAGSGEAAAEGSEGGEAAAGGTAAVSASEGGSGEEGAHAAEAVESAEEGDLEADGAAQVQVADAGDGTGEGDEADGADAQSEGEAQAEEQESEGGEDEGEQDGGEEEESLDARRAFTEQLRQSSGSLGDELAQLVESFKEHNRAEKQGSLAKGGDLYHIDRVTQQMKEQGLLRSKEDVARAVRTSFETLGMKLPGPSQRSQMKTTFEKWVVNTGADIDQEFTSEYWTDDNGAPVTKSPDSDELMPLRMTDIGDYRMLERTKNVVTPENMADLLAFLKMNSWLVIAKLSKHLTSENLESIMETFRGLDDQGKEAWIARQEGVDYKKPSEWANINVNRSVYEKFIDTTIPRLTQIIQQATPEKVGEEGQEPRISKTVAIEFFNELLGYFEDDYLITIAKHMWGTMTEEEFQQLMGVSAEEYAAEQGDITVESGGEPESLDDAFAEDEGEGESLNSDELDSAFAE